MVANPQIIRIYPNMCAKKTVVSTFKFALSAAYAELSGNSGHTLVLCVFALPVFSNMAFVNDISLDESNTCYNNVKMHMLKK